MRHTVAFCLFIAIATASSRAADFDGKWRTSFGTVTLKQSGKNVTGAYGDADQFTLKGTASGKKLTFEYQEGQVTGDGNWTLDDTGHAFRGSFKAKSGRGGEWLGWRPDPESPKADKPTDFSGLWLTDVGLMQLEQTDGKVKGRYSVRGGSDIEGTVTGRRLDFTFKSFYAGKGWLDAAPDGKTVSGAANSNGYPGWFGWRGRRAPEYALHAKFAAGKIVDGSSKGLLTYCIRAPESYKETDKKKWPAVVVLHGSNMNAKAYVNTIASAWPEIAKDFILIGINGETVANTGPDPAFNYTYVNYMGRSTYKGYPGTDRERPALVAEALDDLRDTYPIEKFFVGGHSQGGFLTYVLLMHFPEKIAGAFPISCGLIMQCEPDVFTDETLRAVQRAVPLAIVHGKQDNVVAFSMGEYAASQFGESSWPAFHFFAEEKGAGHRFALLPVDDAIRWLEAQSSEDAKTLLAFADKSFKSKRYRDAIAALNRAGEEGAKSKLASEIEAKAAAGAKKYAPQPDKKNIDAFLAYRDDFEFAPAAAELMKSFNALRAEHDKAAKKLLNEARAAFNQGKRDEGYAKYQEVADNHFAASSYRNVKRWLKERK